MPEEEKKLIPINPEIRGLIVRSPQKVVRELIKFDNEACEFFKSKEFLEEVNKKFFLGKGTIGESDPLYGIKLRSDRKKSGSQTKSRFDVFFGKKADLSWSSVRLTLTVQQNDIATNERVFDSLELSVLHSFYPEDNVFGIEISGGIWFKKYRTSEGNWEGEDHDIAVYLKKMGESRELTFSLVTPPSPEDVFIALSKSAAEILQGFAAQGYIKLPEENVTSDTPGETEDNVVN